ncbi:PQQ-binding-like beta-propeller repeat protein [Streptomyces sp. SID8379]|uniref:serine/threonine-protein kinase n=1 Tax=unclassified Streptomyces TaxID=2593676 RepID=UPI0004778AC4|nr:MULTISPECIES: serine/threonine-protein kinase [unclassified Streptomyces]MYW70232.1 PQQ-binding-like beta-propeller repeat protein [Streptomyces sp. SID8379]
MPSWPNTGSGTEAERPHYAGRYRLEERLGSGGMGVVHLARSAAGLRLAVKVVHAEFARDPEFRGRFRQEVAAARQVSGAFTASVVDADPDAERPWMATLFIPGPTLAEHVKRNGALTPAQLRHVTAGLAEALRDIHRAGVVHRDLKPSNVLLAEDTPKVIDFGISRPKNSELRTETGKLIGTPPFMAPEQFRRPREVGPAADVFALGSLLVHAATGRGPFDSDSPYLVAYQVVHDEPDVTGVPDELAPLILRCLAKEPEDRPTPDGIMAELRRVSARYDTQSFASGGFGSGAPESEAPEPGDHESEGPGDSASGASPSPEAFIPEQRKPSEPPAEELISPVEEGSSRAEGGVWARTRPRRRPVVAAVAGVLALGGVLALTSTLLPGTDDGTGNGTGAGAAQTASPSAFHAWHSPLGDEAAPTCSYGNGSLHCALPGVLAASVDPRDGTVRWRRPASGSGGGSAPAPVLSGGAVLALDPDTSRLRALDPDTGGTLWSMDVSAYRGEVQPVADKVILAAPDGTLTAVDGATGERLWRHGLGAAGPGLSYVGGDLAYAVTLASDGVNTQVSAVDPETGAVRWQRRATDTATPIGVADGLLWCTQRNATSATVALVGRRLSDGTVTRRVRLDLPLPGATATLRDGTVYLLAEGGALVAQDLTTGRQRWRSETSVSRGSAPAVDDEGRVYVMTPDGRLLALSPRTGTLVGQTAPRPSPRSDHLVIDLAAPVVAGGKVYGSAPDGSVFGVDGSHPEDW